MNTEKLREVKKLAWGHTALKWHSEKSNRGLSDSKLTGRGQQRTENTLTASPFSHALNPMSWLPQWDKQVLWPLWTCTCPYPAPSLPSLQPKHSPYHSGAPDNLPQPPWPLIPPALTAISMWLRKPYSAPLDFLWWAQSDSTRFPKSPFFSTLTRNLFLEIIFIYLELMSWPC